MPIPINKMITNNGLDNFQDDKSLVMIEMVTHEPGVTMWERPGLKLVTLK